MLQSTLVERGVQLQHPHATEPPGQLQSQPVRADFSTEPRQKRCNERIHPTPGVRQPPELQTVEHSPWERPVWQQRRAEVVAEAEFFTETDFLEQHRLHQQFRFFR
jgi:hypothetical protein